MSGFNKSGHCRPDIFGIKINGHRLTLLNLLVDAIRHAYWQTSYRKSTRMSHRPLHHKKNCSLMRVHDDNMNLCKGRHWKKEGVVGRKRPPSPVCLYQRRRHLEIWRCLNENSAFAVLSWRHSRDVPSGFAPLPRRAAECWKKMAVSLM